MNKEDVFKETDQFFPEPIKKVEDSSETLASTGSDEDASKGMAEYRKNILKKYHKGSSSLLEKLNKENRSDINSLILALITEIMAETDNLKGNELIATEKGNLRDATIISDKRISALAQAIKASQAKHEFDERNRSGFDIDSPALRLVFAFFMEKVKDSFSSLKYKDEESDIFFRTLGTSLSDWKKELKARLAEKNSIGGETNE